MPKLLLFSHSGLSDEDANGRTMKALLRAWAPGELAEFYCDVQPPDFTAAAHYFRVTDIEMLKAFFGRRVQPVMAESETSSHAAAKGRLAPGIPGWLKRQKYNFAFKWAREYLWMLSPWGHRRLRDWIRAFDPDAILYMVGESLFMDRLVLDVAEASGKPLILYHGEAFRIIDLNKRKGLERAYYQAAEERYGQLAGRAALILYHSEFLRQAYEARYLSRARGVVAYNGGVCDYQDYVSHTPLKLTYFGNLGVGRVPSLLQLADVLAEIDSTLKIDVYGTAVEADAALLRERANVDYHGFVSAQALHEVIEQSDILLHVESFDVRLVDKLKYAFSTKLAQCLCAGRCLLSYAPEGTASTQYLLSEQAAAVATNLRELRQVLTEVVTHEEIRMAYARRGYAAAQRNHRAEVTSQRVKAEITAVLNGEGCDAPAEQ
ncbi:MAG: glycosyltransferase [Clostridiales bacterium]|nr:glycosyltransferase [Clostridiales bacterium]